MLVEWNHSRRYDEHFSKEVYKEVSKDAIGDVGQRIFRCG